MVRIDGITLLLALCVAGAEEIARPPAADRASGPPVADTAPIAVWGSGEGRLGDADGRAGGAIPAGPVIVAGATAVRLELVGYAGSDVILAAGSRASFVLEAGTRSDRRRLVVALAAGRLGVDIDGEGPWEDIEVRGAALAARSDGGEFIVERSAAGDYCALARGQVVVRADAGEERLAVQLQARQGVAASTGGLSAIDQLDRRPQLTDPRPLAEQGMSGAGDDEGGWERDEGKLATRDVPADGRITAVAGWPVDLPAVAVQTAPAAPGPAPSAAEPPAAPPPPANPPTAVVTAILPEPEPPAVVATRGDPPPAALPAPTAPAGTPPARHRQALFEAVAAAGRARDSGGLALAGP